MGRLRGLLAGDPSVHGGRGGIAMNTMDDWIAVILDE